MSVAIIGVWALVAFAAVVCAVLITASASRHRRDRLVATTGRGAVGRVLAVGADDDGMGIKTYWVRVRCDHDGEPSLSGSIRSSGRCPRARAPVR